MKIEIPLKPMSINVAWQGRRYKTKDYKAYERAFFYSTKPPKEKIDGEVAVLYVLYLRYYGRTDVGNLEKPLSDLLVKRGFIEDDRFIKYLQLIKVRSKEEKMAVFIEPFSKEGVEKLNERVKKHIPVDSVDSS